MRRHDWIAVADFVNEERTERGARGRRSSRTRRVPNDEFEAARVDHVAAIRTNVRTQDAAARIAGQRAAMAWAPNGVGCRVRQVVCEATSVDDFAQHRHRGPRPDRECSPVSCLRVVARLAHFEKSHRACADRRPLIASGQRNDGGQFDGCPASHGRCSTGWC